MATDDDEEDGTVYMDDHDPEPLEEDPEKRR